MSFPARPLVAIVPVVLTSASQLDAVARSLVSLYASAPGVPIIAAGGEESDPALLDQVAAALAELDGELVRSPGGLVAAMNAGLAAAAEGGADALVVAQDVELPADEPWLQRLTRAATRRAAPPPSWAAGSCTRATSWSTRACSSPSSSASGCRGCASRRPSCPPRLQPTLCPVSATLQLIRHETLERVGLYDPELALEHADVDFCLRVFAAGLECIYEPSVLARRLTPAARPRTTSPPWSAGTCARRTPCGPSTRASTSPPSSRSTHDPSPHALRRQGHRGHLLVPLRAARDGARPGLDRGPRRSRRPEDPDRRDRRAVRVRRPLRLRGRGAPAARG
jgi:hypothetical protein